MLVAETNITPLQQQMDDGCRFWKPTLNHSNSEWMLVPEATIKALVTPTCITLTLTNVQLTPNPNPPVQSSYIPNPNPNQTQGKIAAIHIEAHVVT